MLPAPPVFGKQAADLGGMVDSTAETSALLLRSARKFREDARATHMPEYAVMMNRTAANLEDLARNLKDAGDPRMAETVLQAFGDCSE
jgi:hypothetical protein